MGKYDAILKEKKVYQDPQVHHSKYTKYVIIYIFSIFLVLGISYFVYYRTVLSFEQVLQSDFVALKKQYANVFTSIIPKNVASSSSLEGAITLEDSVYNYGILREENGLQLELSNQDNYLYSKITSQDYSLELGSFSRYGVVYSQDLLYQDFVSRLKKKISDIKAIKNLYLEGNVPIVEFSFSLSEKDINDILGSNYLKDKYNIIVTIKNNALTNEAVSVKCAITNQGNGLRSILEYKDKEIVYEVSKAKKYRLNMENKKKNFQLRIYENGELYSVFSGEASSYRYCYSYQVINKVYNLQLIIQEEKGGYSYSLNSSIEKDGETTEKTVKAVLRNGKNDLLEESDAKRINYQNLTSSEKDDFQKKLKEFLSPLEKLVHYYKNDINELNNH